MNIGYRITHLEHRQRERRRGVKGPGYYRREFKKKIQDIYRRSKDLPVIFSEMSLAEKTAFMIYEPERFTPEEQDQAVEQIRDLRERICKTTEPG